MRTAVLQATLKAVRSIDRNEIRQRIATAKSPVYGIERSKPGVIVRYGKTTSARGAAPLRERAASYGASKKKRRAARG